MLFWYSFSLPKDYFHGAHMTYVYRQWLLTFKSLVLNFLSIFFHHTEKYFAIPGVVWLLYTKVAINIYIFDSKMFWQYYFSPYKLCFPGSHMTCVYLERLLIYKNVFLYSFGPQKICFAGVIWLVYFFLEWFLAY